LVARRWPAFRDRYRPLVEAAVDAGAFAEVMERLVREALLLSHVAFYTPERARLVDERAAGADVPAFLALTWRSAPACRYVKLPSFSIPLFRRQALDRALAGLGDDRPVVLDLRLNTGGALSATGEALGALLGPDVAFARTRLQGWRAHPTPEDAWPEPEAQNEGNALDVQRVASRPHVRWRTSPAPRVAVRGPLVVLVSARTFSCGEVFAAALQDRGRALLVGARTAGAVVAARDDLDCGQGYRLCLPFADLVSEAGRPLEGCGVTPDVEREFNEPDTEPLSDRELATLVAELSSHFPSVR
jgi:C-terminal processing protease CtpA/Prc